jgi:hypothetical protein
MKSWNDVILWKWFGLLINAARAQAVREVMSGDTSDSDFIRNVTRWRHAMGMIRISDYRPACASRLFEWRQVIRHILKSRHNVVMIQINIPPCMRKPSFQWHHKTRHHETSSYTSSNEVIMWCWYSLINPALRAQAVEWMTSFDTSINDVIWHVILWLHNVVLIQLNWSRLASASCDTYDVIWHVISWRHPTRHLVTS